LHLPECPPFPYRRMGGFTTVGRTLVNHFTLPSVVLFTSRFSV
jgi:hypothetical protein